MKTIKIIKDGDFGLSFPVPEKYEERKAVRAIVFDVDGNVALLYSTKMQFHAVPGGGIKEEEDFIAALRRESIEELGCNVSNIRELGVIEEYRNKLSTRQISYGFVADIVGEKTAPHFEKGELEVGFEAVWMPFEKAIQTMENEANPDDYRGKFINTRDILFLKEARNFIV